MADPLPPSLFWRAPLCLWVRYGRHRFRLQSQPATRRLWKFVKKKWLYSKYYPDSAAFQHAIRDCLAKVPTHYQAALDTLLTLRFQTFTTVPVVGDLPATGLAPIVAPAATEVLSMAA